MKTKVRVTLIAEEEVEIEVEHAEDEDPTDLNESEERAATHQASPWPRWTVDHSRVRKI